MTSEEKKAKKRAYNDAHRDEQLACKRAYYQTHKEEIRLRSQALKEQKRLYSLAYRAANKDRIREAQKLYDATHTQQRQAAHFKRKYGLSVESVEQLSVAQGGACAVCGEKTKLSVDHSHKDGHVRGLLCIKCNTGIGMLKDDPEVLRKAATYLEEK